MIRFYLEERVREQTSRAIRRLRGRKERTLLDFAPRGSSVMLSNIFWMSSLQGFASGNAPGFRAADHGGAGLHHDDTLQLQLQINKAKVSSSRVISMLRYERKEMEEENGISMCWHGFHGQPWMRKKVDERGGWRGELKGFVPLGHENQEKTNWNGRPSPFSRFCLFGRLFL